MSEKLSALPLSTALPDNARLYAVDPAEMLPADRSRAVELHALRKILSGSAVDGREIYVTKDGNDTTGDGSLLAPFLTVQAAINFATGPTVSNQFNVIIGPGIYAENLTLKQYVHLSSVCSNGIGQNSNGPVQVLGEHTVNLSDWFGTLVCAGIDFSAAGAGRCTRSGTGTLIFTSCCLPGIVHGAGGSTYYLGSHYTGTLQVSQGTHVLNGCRLGNVVAAQAYSGDAMTLEMVGCHANELMVRGTGSVTIVARLFGSDLRQTVFNPNSGSPTYNVSADASLVPSSLNISGGTFNWTRRTQAGAVLYAPDDPSDWASPPPVTVAEALDRLAAANPGA